MEATLTVRQQQLGEQEQSVVTISGISIPEMVSRTHSSPQNHSQRRGFSLIEIMVVLGMLTIIGSVSFLSNSGQRKVTILNAAANQTASLIKQSQIAGYSGQADTTGVYSKAFGVHIEQTLPDSMTYFSDRNNNHVYATDSSEREKAYQLPKGITLQKVCGTNSGGVDECSDSTIEGIDIVFVRPSSDPYIYRYYSNGTVGTVYTQAKIYLQSANVTKMILVTHTGKIAIQ